MTNNYLATAWLSTTRCCYLTFLLVLTALTTRAQAPPWAEATPGTSSQTTGSSQTRSVATDASGNVFVTGYFTGQVAFGSTLLTSRGGQDLFVAKYVLRTGTWAWAQSGGGTNNDAGYGVAVSGSSVYVTGYVTNTTSNVNGVLFGGTVPVAGASAINSIDLVLAKYTDNGTSATLGWTQVGGGTSADAGYGVAASGQRVLVVGTMYNNSSNVNQVLYGGTGVAGVSSTSSDDLVLAKYIDNGTSATLGWTQVGGGTGIDFGQGVAISGANVYVTGTIYNTASNASQVLFGGTGTTPGTVSVAGASSINSQDVVLAKYTDNGPSATLGWTQVGGGANFDIGYDVAVNGSSVYMTGQLFNSSSNVNGVLFGGTGTTPGTVPVAGASTTNGTDLVLAKYTDNGTSATLGWTQVDGGAGPDYGQGVAVSGANVYVTGAISNTASNVNGVLFGGTVSVAGASTTSSQDVVLAKYTDNGNTATLGWAQVGGGTGADVGYDVAASGQNVIAVGVVVPSASFGSYAIATPAGSSVNVLARVVDATLTPLPVRNGTLAGSPHLYPNPTTTGVTTLSGLAAGTWVQVLDALGRVVATATTTTGGFAPLVLPVGLPGGVYVVRAGQQAWRLSVE
jgi:hypothetical protein